MISIDTLYENGLRLTYGFRYWNGTCFFFSIYMSKDLYHLIIGRFIVPGNLKVVNLDIHTCALDVIVTYPSVHEKMAIQSKIIALYFHVIPHVDTNELWHACLSHNYLFYMYMFILEMSKVINMFVNL